MIVKKLLEEYIKMIVEQTPLARVPNQLISPDDVQGKEDVEDESDAGDVNEFSGVGGIMGYSLPLGMDPDAAGRRKNRPRPKK